MAHAKYRIILIEDDGSMRKAVERVLLGAGYAVKAFESAEAMLDALPEEGMPDGSGCFVCDVRLPGVSGFELHRRLAEHGPMPPWIFITAHDDPAVREQAQHAAAAYLLKPFEGRALLGLVERVMHPP